MWKGDRPQVHHFIQGRDTSNTLHPLEHSGCETIGGTQSDKLFFLAYLPTQTQTQ